MELIVLGSCGTWAVPDRANSGYLIRHDGHVLWVDLGSGTLANLQRYADLHEIDAVVISHSHPDHMVDLYPYFYARHYGLQLPPGTPLFAPPGLINRAVALLSEESALDLARTFAITEVEPGDSFGTGPFRVRTAPMAHPVPTLGMRIEADGMSVAYTADTGPTQEIDTIASGTNLLLAEATWQDDGSFRPPLHLTAKQAGEAATRTGVGRLLLTHIWPTLDLERSRDEAAGTFDGDVQIAMDNSVLEVG